MNFAFVRGSQLLRADPAGLHKQYGCKIIHQSWKSTRIPKQHVQHVLSWSKYHPDALQVLWTDEDNDNLVKQFYPQYYPTYKNLALVIQRCDLVRLLYLHRYGGVYADLDYEAHQNIFPYLPPDADVMVVESPVILNEVMQNSLMVSRVLNHPLWVRTVDSIVEITSFINSRDKCYAKKWGGCKLLEMFHNPFTKKVSNMAFTLYISGPAVIDKTYVRHRNSGWKLALLPKDQFFIGKYTENGVATHHQANSWVSFRKACPEIIAAGAGALVLIIVLVAVLVAVVYGNKCKVWK